MTGLKTFFSDDGLEALREIVRAIKLDMTWPELSRLTNVHESRLKEFVDPEQDKVLKFRKFYDLLLGIETYIRDNPAAPVRRLCPEQLAFIFQTQATPLPMVKKELRLDEEDQRRLSKELAGTFVGFRQLRDEGVLVAHLRVFDSYARQGMPMCYFRRQLGNGGEVKVSGALFRKEPRIFFIGEEITHRCVRHMALRMMGGHSDILTGVLSGFETTFVPFSSRLIAARLKEHVPYRSFRARTGLVREPEALDHMVEELCRRPEETKAQLAFRPDHYIDFRYGDGPIS